MSKNDENWKVNYEALKAFVETYKHLPNKNKVENRGLLNWWKYNQRLLKQGKLNTERVRLLKELSEMRETKKCLCSFKQNKNNI